MTQTHLLRLKVLDKNVSDVLTSNKSFFNEEKAAATLKESQKEERASIDKGINEAQSRIDILKSDYAKDTAVIQARIDKLREGTSNSKVGVEAQIETAENNILKAQNNIDDLIIEKLIKSLYSYLFGQNTKLRSKKIEILIKSLKNKNFNKYILKKMNI